MKNPIAVLALALAAIISTNASAQSGALRPMDPAFASQISGGRAPAPPAPAPVAAAPYQAPVRQPLKPLPQVASASAPASQPLQPMPSAQPLKPLYVEAMPNPAAVMASPIVTTTSLPAGTRLSVALERYVKERGWDIRWQINEDYVLDANLPIPSSDLIEAVTWVVHTYQTQGGLLGVVPRFARSNRVVVIEKMDVRDNY